MITTLKQTTVRNIGYNALARGITTVFQGIASVILSRLLFSSDYGIVGFATFFINFLVQFNDLGVNSAFIQKKEINDRFQNTAFIIKTFLGITLFLTTFFIAPIASHLFDNAAVTDVIRLLSLNFLINCFSFLPMSLLNRELNYKKLSIINITSSIAQSSIAIILAICGYKYWSIVIGSLLSSVVILIMANVIKPQKIKIQFDKQIAKELFHFGWKIFASGIVIFSVLNADNFIVGSVKGSSSLGYYVIGFTWGSEMCTIIRYIVHNVLFPTYSKIQQDFSLVKEIYLKVLEYVSVIGVLINTVLFIVAKDFLVIVLGHGTDKWLPALSILRIFCFYGIIRVILEPIGNVIMAVGKPAVLLRANTIAAALEISLAYPAVVYFGLEGVAVVVLIACVVQYFVYIPFMRKELNISLRDLVQSVKPAIISICALVPVFLVYSVYSGESSTMLLVEKIVVSLLCYVVAYGFQTKWRIVGEARTLRNAIIMK